MTTKKDNYLNYESKWPEDRSYVTIILQNFIVDSCKIIHTPIESKNIVEKLILSITYMDRIKKNKEGMNRVR